MVMGESGYALAGPHETEPPPWSIAIGLEKVPDAHLHSCPDG